MSEKMLFCVGDGREVSSGEGYKKSYRVFNKQLTKEQWEKVNSSFSSIKLPVTKWIGKDDMTDEEKENSSVRKEIGGFLRVLSYEQAWKSWWDDASKSDKKKILDCEYFDAKIFKDITGLEVEKENSKKEELLKKANELIEKAQELRDEANKF